MIEVLGLFIILLGFDEAYIVNHQDKFFSGIVYKDINLACKNTGRILIISEGFLIQILKCVFAEKGFSMVLKKPFPVLYQVSSLTIFIKNFDDRQIMPLFCIFAFLFDVEFESNDYKVTN